MNRVIRITVPALVAAAFILPSLAQRPDKAPADRVDQAKEMVALIKEGQLDLTGATKLAEIHVKGNALNVTCEIRPIEDRSNDKERSGGPSMTGDPPIGKRLLYDITCFAKEKVQVVQVDGLSKKVVEEK
jgi:hypothetical protein